MAASNNRFLFSKLSVLVTCFNKLNFLSKGIETLTVLIENNVEIIIVDDGSNDGSEEILRNFHQQNTNLTLIRTPNNGSASARNLAKSHATREYIFFLDIDDNLIIDELYEMLKSIDSLKTDAVFANYRKYSRNFSSTITKSIEKYPNFNVGIPYNFSSVRDEVFPLLGYWRILYKREFLSAKGILFSPTFLELENNYFVLDDLFFLLIFFSNKGKIAFLAPQAVVYEYNTNGDVDLDSWFKFLAQAKIFIRAALFVNNKFSDNFSGVDSKWFKLNLYTATLRHISYLRLNDFFKVLRGFYILNSLLAIQPYSKFIKDVFSVFYLTTKNSFYFSRLSLKLFLRKLNRKIFRVLKCELDNQNSVPYS